MPSSDHIHVIQAVQYDGSNVSEILALTGGMLHSNVGGVLTIMDGSGTMVTQVFTPGDWWVLGPVNPGWWSQAQFSAEYITRQQAIQDNDTIFNPSGLQSQINANSGAITALNASQATQDTAIAAAASAAAGKLSKVDLVSISVPVLLLNATADRAITWNRPFNNTNYDLSYAFDASTIGRITCAPVAGTKTTTGVTIRITAGLLAVSVLGVVHVLGIGA